MIDGQAPVEVFDEIDSTILEARRRAERNEVSPVWLIAKSQTAGRGRRGRAWTSHSGNLMATLLFSTDQPPQQYALLGFANGDAIAETIDAIAGAGTAQLKWPNDVFINGAKVAGIMLASGSIASGQTWVALAFGVNLADAPSNIDQKTVCLRDLLPPDAPAPEPLAFLASMRPTLEAWSTRIVSEGDRKSTRLNSSHVKISYAVFCLKKKKDLSHSE